ncbi:MAG: tRNA (adenosine(37)-N6)-dimethylallyltransferase MiaA [Anaerolineae bacterium]
MSTVLASRSIVAIIGPTGIGKTALAVALAQRFGGEIVSADSRQFYRGMDIGTAKPSASELAAIPHHLIDIANPDESISLARFRALASAAIAEIHARLRLPILVGGTGQYVWGFLEGWDVPQVPPDDALRERLYAEAEAAGDSALHARLASVDPVAAERIDPRNVRRVVRALEVYYMTGRPISSLQTKSPPPYRTLILGLTLDRPALYARLDARIDAMIAAGLEAEIRRLVAQGYGFDLPAMSALGYAEFEPLLRGEATLDDVVSAIKRNTRRFVRHQSAWFRKADPRIHWLDVADDPLPLASQWVQTFLEEA